MLDDLKLIHERDAQDALGVAASQWQQLTYAFTPSGNTKFSNVYNVVYAAMGGSAMAASLVNVWPKLGEPLEIVRDYDLPAYVDGDTLVIVSSYSGNTEETLSALEQAEAKGAQIAVITGGGKLQQIAEEKGYLLFLLPETRFARCATFWNFRAALEVLALAGLLQKEDFAPALEAGAKFLQQAIAQWLPDIATATNQAKQLAQEVIGKSVVLYSGPKMTPVAYKWKFGFNENAKQIAWLNQLPEFNHNEFTGWSKEPTEKPYVVIDLRSNLENPRIQKRFEVTARLLSGMRPEPLVVQPDGGTLLEQLLWGIALGDFVGLYTAMLNGENPTPLPLVDKLKTAMAA